VQGKDGEMSEKKDFTDKEKEIIAGWEIFAKTYKPTPLSPLERAQLKQMRLEIEIAKNTPFVLGEPLR
jgi:hypothetical protein